MLIVRVTILDSSTQGPSAYLEGPDALLHCAVGINIWEVC